MRTTPQNRRQKQKRLRRVDLLVCASKEHYVSKDEAQRQARRAHKHTGIPSRWYICPVCSLYCLTKGESKNEKRHNTNGKVLHQAG